MDIIEFLEKEDARLDVIFLTLNCEEIPSKVHNRDALEEVYLLLDKNEYEYTEVMSNLHAKELAINAHTKMLDDIKKDMCKGFNNIADIIKNLKSSNMNNAIPTEEDIPGEVQNTHAGIGSIQEPLHKNASNGNPNQNTPSTPRVEVPGQQAHVAAAAAPTTPRAAAVAATVP